MSEIENICPCGHPEMNCLDCGLKLCDADPRKCTLHDYFTQFFGRVHSKCTHCGLHFVCNPYGNGGSGRRCSVFSWVTNVIAVGTADTPYSLFHFIVNLNYPDNGCELGECKEYKSEHGAHILAIGLDENGASVDVCASFAKSVSRMCEWLTEKGYTSNHRILFHCLAGVNRSAAACVFMMLRKYRIPTRDGYHLVRNSRPMVNISLELAALLDLV